jgi:ligand-binding sensor domain-containing protein
MMFRPQKLLPLNVAGPRRSTFIMLVGLVVGVMVLAPTALTQLGSLRAAQSETKERSEYETSERMHVASHQVRCSRHKSAYFGRFSSLAQAADTIPAKRRAAAENQLRVPLVVDWTATMRC